MENNSLIRLALWADGMTAIKTAGMSWPGFSYNDAEWARMATLAKAVDRGSAMRFQLVNAAVFIALAAVLIAGAFVPLLTLLYPDPADTQALTFALLLAATAFVAIGAGLPLSMRIAAPLAAGKSLRCGVREAPGDAELASKVTWQIRRIAVFMCGALVPGILLFIAYDIDAGPIITALKWLAAALMAGSTAHTLRRRRNDKGNGGAKADAAG